MQINNKAWLQLSQQQNYLPVIILQRSSKYKSLVIDQNNIIDRKLAYHADDQYLLPRTKYHSLRDLLDMEYVNLPQLRFFLTNQHQNHTSNASKSETKKYITVGTDLLIRVGSSSVTSNQNSQQLLQFYKSHLDSLLIDNKCKEKYIAIFLKNQIVLHSYIAPLLQIFRKGSQYCCPYQNNIQNLNVILNKFLCNVNMEIKFGFLQNQHNKSSKIAFVHLKPYIPAQPSQGLIIPQQMLNLGIINQQAQKDKSSSGKPQKLSTDSQTIINSLSSLGVQSSKINQLLKLLSVIIHLNQFSSQQQTNVTNNKSKSDQLSNICKMLDLPQNKLQKLFASTPIHNNSNIELQQLYLQQLGTTQQITYFKIHTLKFILYQMFITNICNIINKKLCPSQYLKLINNQCNSQISYKKIKVLILYIHVNHLNILNMRINEDKIQKKLKQSLLWVRGRTFVYEKMQQIVKSNIISSIIGIKQQQNTPTNSNNKNLANNIKLFNLKISQNGKSKKQKKVSPDKSNKKCHNLQPNIKQHLGYAENLLYFQQQPQAKNLLQQQSQLYQLFIQLRSTPIINEISTLFFKQPYTYQTIKTIPSTFSTNLWNNYLQLTYKNSINFTSSSAVITDSNYIIDDIEFTKKILDSIHKRKIFMENEDFDQKINGFIQVGFRSFAHRYIYTSICKQQIHRIYTTTSSNSISANQDNLKAAYTNHEQAVEILMQKIKLFLKKQQQIFSMVDKKKGYKKQKVLICIKSLQIFEQMEQQVQNQYIAVQKIQCQYLVYKNRKNTFQIVHQIAKTKKLTNILINIQKKILYPNAMDKIKSYYTIKIKQQQRKKQAEENQIKLSHFVKVIELIQTITNKRIGFTELKIYDQMTIKENQQEEQRINQKKQQQQKRNFQQYSIQNESLMRSNYNSQKSQQSNIQNPITEPINSQQLTETQIKPQPLPKEPNPQKPQQQITKYKVPRMQQKIKHQKKKQQKQHILQKIKSQMLSIKSCNHQQSSNIYDLSIILSQQFNQQSFDSNQFLFSSHKLSDKYSNSLSQSNHFIHHSQNINSYQQLKTFLQISEKQKPNQTVFSKQIQSQNYHSSPLKSIVLQASFNNQLSKQQQESLNQQSSYKKSNKSQIYQIQNYQTPQIKNDNKSKIPPNSHQSNEPSKSKSRARSNNSQISQSIQNDSQSNQTLQYSITIPPAPKITRSEKLKKSSYRQSINNQNLQYSSIQPTKNLSLSQSLYLTKKQLTTLADTPYFSLQLWQITSKIKCIKQLQQCQRLLSKYTPIANKPPSQPHQLIQLRPDKEVLELLTHQDYLAYTKQHFSFQNQQIYYKMITNQKQQLTKPFFVDYPRQKYPKLYKDAFNAILKIGLQKKTTKKLHQLLNIFIIPLYQIFYKQLQSVIGIFDETKMIPPDYSSDYNVIKDEIFFYFIKQISLTNPQKYIQKCYHSYLFGLSIFSRYFCPSPHFLYPFTRYIYILYQDSIKNKSNNFQLLQLLQSIFVNLLFFVQANQQFKHNPVNAFNPKPSPILKTQKQSAGYLYPRKIPISQHQIGQIYLTKKPQLSKITIRLLNNQSFTYQIRNQMVKTLKKKVLADCGIIVSQQFFNLYSYQHQNIYKLINDDQKAIHLVQQIAQRKSQNRQLCIYLRITHYFPFQIKDISILKMVYMTMISDQYSMPFTGQKYSFIVAQSMIYSDYQEIRVNNYLNFSNQKDLKVPNVKAIQQKYRQQTQRVNKKICQFQYLKYLKSQGLFLIKCFRNIYHHDQIVGVKPFQIVFYQQCQKISSISVKRIKSVELSNQSVILTLYYKAENQNKQRLRILKIDQIQQYQQLFQSIQFVLQNFIQI